MLTSRKNPKSNAIVVAGPATDDLIVAAIRSASAVARIAGSGGSIEQEDGTILVSDRPYATAGGLTIDAEEIYYRAAEQTSSARRLGEADKVAWLDHETQLECIMMRAGEGGFLGGYVGIPPSHPLYGFSKDAIPSEIDVHGGVSYAAACQARPSARRSLRAEAERICHPRARPKRTRAPLEAAVHHQSHQDAWWLGFTCDKVYDVILDDVGDRKRFLGAEIGGAYRDDDYVCREIEHLARQLKAIADCEPMPVRRGPPAPPLGLDAGRGA